MAEPNIRVLCVDDHHLVREGIVQVISLQHDITVVAQAATGEEAIEQFLRCRPDVTLMDLQLRGTSGLAAIQAIRRADADARIVVLTMYKGDEDIYRAIQAGAVGYLLKDTVPEDLARVIRAVYAGKQSLPEEIARKLAVRTTQPTFTRRELEILEWIARGMRNKEIAAKLNISEETARTHLKSIFLKFDVHDRTAALSEALRRGVIHID